jgi:hypothetical protein
MSNVNDSRSRGSLMFPNGISTAFGHRAIRPILQKILPEGAAKPPTVFKNGRKSPPRSVSAE